MSDNTAKLSFNGKTLDLPMYKGTFGDDFIDIGQVGKEGTFTLDPGFVSTASCESKITYIDGAKGILLYRGYPIDQLAAKSDFLEVCYLLLFGELPPHHKNKNSSQKSICIPWYTNKSLTFLMGFDVMLIRWQ